MSRTRKDSFQNEVRALDVVKTEDGRFDLFLGGKLAFGQIAEAYLAEELCVRFGFCGEEYKQILHEVNQNGRTTIVF